MKKILVLGLFDSVHKGHRYVFDRARTYRTNEDFLCVATFADGFFKAVGKDSEEIYLLRERLTILREIGIDDLWVFPSDPAFLRKSKEEFCAFIGAYGPAVIVAGEDYTFGNRAEGSVRDLQEYFVPLGTEVVVCPIVMENGEKISSEKIRFLLKRGEIERANLWLVRPFSYSGNVVKGRKDGRKLGFPTLNLNVEPEKILIGSGVYVTQTKIGKRLYNSVTNVGGHPTFRDVNQNVETYILDQSVEAYGREVTVFFHSYIRDIVTFDNASQLMKQIEQDVEYARRWLEDDKIRRSGKQ